MKKIILILCVLICTIPVGSQTSTFLMGAYWTGSNEITKHHDISSGLQNNLAVMSGVTGIIQGESTYDAAGARYFDHTNLGITVVDAATGTVISVFATTPAFMSMEYNSNTGNLLGVRWNGSAEIFSSMTPSSGAVSNIATLSGATSIVQGESTFDAATNTYFMKSNLGIMVINASTGSLINTINTSTPALKGMEFDSNTGKLLGTYWNGSSEIFASMNITSGAITNIAALTGVFGVVQGESTFDASGNRYFNRTNLGIMVIDASTGSVITTFTTMPNLNGMEYIGTGSVPCNLTITSPPSIVNASQGSNVNISVSCNATNPTCQWQTNACNLGWINVPSNTSYSGGNTLALAINNVSVQNHLQAFRAIVSSDNCSDTSNTATIHLTDTCVVTDTIHITVIDSLITGVPQSYANVLRVYPNPATAKLTIDNGDFNSMSGYSIRISNSYGQEIFKQAVTQKIMQVDLAAMEGKGVYYLQVLDVNGIAVEVRKIIVQ